ncbi:hypothetical protein PSPO01_10833 [Paraphaeosphaeria sporulosa]
MPVATRTGKKKETRDESVDEHSSKRRDAGKAIILPTGRPFATSAHDIFAGAPRRMTPHLPTDHSRWADVLFVTGNKKDMETKKQVLASSASELDEDDRHNAVQDRLEKRTFFFAGTSGPTVKQMPMAKSTLGFQIGLLNPVIGIGTDAAYRAVGKYGSSAAGAARDMRFQLRLTFNLFRKLPHTL